MLQITKYAQKEQYRAPQHKMEYKKLELNLRGQFSGKQYSTASNISMARSCTIFCEKLC
jgi:hypothetical protein